MCVCVQAVFSEGSLIAEMRAETAGWLLLSLQLVSDSVTPWTVARQAPLSMGFSRQESWSWLPFPSPGDLPDPGIEPGSSTLAGGGFFTRDPRELVVVLNSWRTSRKKMLKWPPCLIATVAGRVWSGGEHSWRRAERELGLVC